MIVRDLPSLPFAHRARLPAQSCVYFITDESSMVVYYIGATYNLRARMKNHQHHEKATNYKCRVHWSEYAIDELAKAEQSAIAKHQPVWNGAPVAYQPPTGDKMTRFLMSDGADVLKQVDEHAEREGTSRAALYRRAMREMLDRQSKEETTDHDNHK